MLARYPRTLSNLHTLSLYPWSIFPTTPAFPSLIFWFLFRLPSVLSLPGKHLRPKIVWGRGYRPVWEELVSFSASMVPHAPVCTLAQASWKRDLEGTVPEVSPLELQSPITHWITGPSKAVQLSLYMSFLAGFCSQITPSATGRYDPLAFEGVEMGASKDLLSWKPRLLRGPKGHFWKWFGIWSQSSSIRTVVKSCYFLTSGKRLSRSCQFCFFAGGDWIGGGCGSGGWEEMIGWGFQSLRAAPHPKQRWQFGDGPAWLLVKSKTVKGTLRLDGVSHKWPPSQVGKEA